MFGFIRFKFVNGCLPIKSEQWGNLCPCRWCINFVIITNNNNSTMTILITLINVILNVRENLLS